MFKPATLLASFVILVIFLSASCGGRSVIRPAGELTTIAGTSWMLISLNEQEVLTPEGVRTSYIKFEAEDSEVEGFAGCNQFSGKYTASDSTLTMSRLSSTRMSCPNMEMEATLLKTLENVSAYNITGDLLTLYQGKRVVATFRASNAIGE